MNGMTSYLFNCQWATDKNERNYKHMSVIPFPGFAYALITYKIDDKRIISCNINIDPCLPQACCEV